MHTAIKISILITGLITANVSPSSAEPSVEDGCEFYDSSSASIPNAGLRDLLQTLPESSSVIVCNGKRNVEISILDPIAHRDGVSYYRRHYFEVPADKFSKARQAKDLMSGRRNFHLTMMALDPNSKLTHQSEDIVRTQSISPGTFKAMYEFWMEITVDTEKLRDKFDASSLDEENKAKYEKFIQSLDNSTEATIDYLEFEELRLADGDGIELEFFPRLSVNISTKTQWWEINYDMLDSERYTLLNVELRMEAKGAK